MNRRIAAISSVLLAVALALAGSANAGVIGLYRNGMESDGLRAQIVNFSGQRCKRGGSSHAFRIFVGKETKECAYRTPVLGRDLEVAAVGRLLEGTPKPLQRKAFLALDLRAGGAGARYQLAVFPLQRKAQLLRYTSESQVEYLRVARSIRTKGINRANELRLRAFNVTGGPEKGKCRVMAWVGRQLVADVVDPASGELQGRAAGFSLGAVGNAKGALGSFDDVVVRVPSPF
ncbi:MAG TPA: hypothetical protein VFN89_06980 [Solirubrobacterales bacterium]|nr:hypothetical protein [Solirubrobacterales bacterium]